MLNRLISKLLGPLAWEAGLSDEQLVKLFRQLGSTDPKGRLLRLRRGEQSLIGACMDLLSEGKALTDVGFVDQAYRRLLAREPDSKGFQGYVEGLASCALCRAELVHSFLRSQEFRELFGASNRAPRGATPHVGARRAYATDWLQRMLYGRCLLPPLSMRRSVGEKLWDISGERFEVTGRDFVEKLVRDAGLRAESRIVDVGAGCGRIAIPLTEVVGPSGYYRGVEAARAMVRWCRRRITPRFPHFQFFHCDVRNKVYNPRGQVEPEAYRFPFGEDSFDLVVATSVFTHLLPDATLNYIEECGRVLRRGGVLFGTFYLTDSGTRSADGELVFVHPVSKAALSVDRARPERAVAYNLDWLVAVFRRSGLELVPPVRWGGWSGKVPAYSGQDVLIFRK